MEASGSAQVVDDEAARWVARLDSRPLDQGGRADLKEWLERDERHRGALVRALAIWHAIGDGDPIEEEVWDLILPGELPNLDVQQAPANAVSGEGAAKWFSIQRRRLLWAGAAAVASILPVGVLTGILPGFSSDHVRRINTRIGEMTKVPLTDGSLVVVNTSSDLEVQQSARLRSVRLKEGEAWFKVAKDASRPFVVSAGGVRVRAVGTAFSVRRLNQGADVQVTEGVVEVWSEARADNRLKLPAGTRTFVSERLGAQELVNDADEIERELSWREGVLKFDGSTLRQAVDEFNRYNVTKLQIDPALAGEKVVGRFDTTDPDAFARVVSAAFRARIDKQEGRIRIEKY